MRGGYKQDYGFCLGDALLLSLSDHVPWGKPATMSWVALRKDPHDQELSLQPMGTSVVASGSSSPVKSPDDHSPGGQLVFNLSQTIQLGSHWPSEIINACCFKLLRFGVICYIGRDNYYRYITETESFKKSDLPLLWAIHSDAFYSIFQNTVCNPPKWLWPTNRS